MRRPQPHSPNPSIYPTEQPFHLFHTILPRLHSSEQRMNDKLNMLSVHFKLNYIIYSWKFTKVTHSRQGMHVIPKM